MYKNWQLITCTHHTGIQYCIYIFYDLNDFAYKMVTYTYIHTHSYR